MKYNRYSVLTMFGHICTDINQGALPALLPFLVLHKDISYASAAGLIFAANSMSSFIQPLFGYLGDRVSWPWLMGLGSCLAGGGLALVGFLDSYWAIFAAVTVSGIGVALFHPEGGRMANLAAGENKGAGIALFAVGGNIGFALGPIITSIALAVLGLKGTIVFLLPALSMAMAVLVSLKNLSRISSESQNKKPDGKQSQEKDDWKSFFKVSACITSRSVVTYGLTTFIPLYFAAVMMLPETAASATLTLYSAVAATATLFGGQAADRLGFHRVIRGGFLLLVPLMLIFPMINSVHLAIFLLVPIAVSANAPQGATIALGQKFLPGHIGTSSGIMLGLAVSIGGMVAPGIGWVGDKCGLPAAMYVVAAFAVLTMCLAFLIPDSEKKRRQPSDRVDAP
jgi:FSR family fosmidomycin resistance protein-like MFS transporter